jgi:peroxidase
LAWTIWGQFIDHDIEHSPSSDNDTFHIPIPRCDKFFDADCNGSRVIPFTRSIFNLSPTGVRTPINALTTWIDGSMIYGSSVAQSNNLRSFKQGKLRTDSTGRMLP